MTGIRLWLQGKKTYITALVGFVGAILAWSNGQIDLTGLLEAAWVAIMACTVKAGQVTSASTAITKAVDDGTLKGG
jgi:hypothetical protein